MTLQLHGSQGRDEARGPDQVGQELHGTDWWDFEDLVLSQDAVITDGKGRDMGDEFLLAMGHNKELVAQKTDRPRLSIRWVLAAGT